MPFCCILACIISHLAVFCNGTIFYNFSKSLICTVMQAREYLSKLGDLYQTQIFAKIENIEVFSIYLYLITQLILYWPKPNVMLVLCTYLNLSFFQGLTHFDEILQEADGIILSRGNLGIDLPPEKVSSKFNEAVFLHIA